jgi:hypothetical protein
MKKSAATSLNIDFFDNTHPIKLRVASSHFYRCSGSIDPPIAVRPFVLFL